MVVFYLIFFKFFLMFYCFLMQLSHDVLFLKRELTAFIHVLVKASC